MTTQPPQEPEPSRDVAPPGPPGYEQPAYAPAPQSQGHAGPWILAAAVVLVLGALAAVFIHNEGTDTQTVINRTPTVNTTSVERSAPTVTQTTTTLTQPAKTTTTVTVTPKATTETGTTTTP